MVPQKMAKATPTRSKLLIRNVASRDTKESSWFSLLSCGHRHQSSRAAPIMTTAIRKMNGGPMLVSENACTDERRPLRVSSVPKSTSAKVTEMRLRFQTFSIPRFCWIMTEWR